MFLYIKNKKLKKKLWKAMLTFRFIDVFTQHIIFLRYDTEFGGQHMHVFEKNFDHIRYKDQNSAKNKNHE